MNNGLLYFGCFLALLLAALFGVPYAVDWNGYRGVFEEEASKVLGRDVRVAGDVTVRFLPTPYVRFQKVRLADTTGQTGEPFIRAESFTMRLAVSPLLRGAFEANEIELTKPVLSLVPDKEGSGNWASLELRPAELPFIPQNVALHSVRLVDGTLAVHRADGGGISRIEGIDGELSAETLKGPFKFKGSGSVAGARRDIKFATFAPEAGGTVRFKAVMHGEEGDNSYVFDGQVDDFTTRPRVAGELTGRLVLPAPPSPDGKPGKEPAPVINLKSAVKADARGAVFEAVELDLDGAAEPQIITGGARAQWAGETRMDAALAAKWLDLDLLAAPKGQQTSIAGLKQLFVTLLEGLAGGGTAGVRLDVEQIKFGGEQAGSFRLDAERRQDMVALRQLRCGLPGGARFELSGTLSNGGGGGTGKGPLFTGEGMVRGVNFERAQAFAQRSGIDIDLKSQGPFWIAGNVAISDARFALTDAKAEIAGQPVAGDVIIERGERPRLSLRLEGNRIDTAVFFPGEAAHATAALRQAVGLAKPEQSAARGSRPDTAVRLAAAELRHDGQVFKDVDARLLIEGSVLNVASAHMTTSAGARVKAMGRIDTGSGGDAAPTAKGTLSYELDAASKEAIAEAAQLSGAAQVLSAETIAALPSLQIGGLLKLGSRAPASADVSFDGTAGAMHIAGEAAFDGGFLAWQSAPVQFSASARTADLTQVLSLLGTSAPALKGMAVRPGEATVSVSGPLQTGARSYADINAEGLSAALEGTLTLAGGKTFAHTGSGRIKARDAREALALAGVAASGGLAQASLEGPFEIATQDGTTSLASQGLKAAASTLKGRVSLKRAPAHGSPARITGDIEADRVSVGGLLSWLTDAGKEAEASDESTAAVWPETQFNLDALTHAEGAINFKTAQLELADDLKAREASAEIVFGPGKVRIAKLRGQAAGGPLALEAELEKSPVGVTLSAHLNLDADLAALSPSASGRAVLDLTGSGRALNPASAIGAFSGQGTIKLASARHPGPSPALVADAGDAVLQGKLANDPASLAPVLAAGLENAAIVAGTRTIPLSVAGGDVKVEAYNVEGPQGHARITTTVSLTKLLLDSAWQVSAIASPLPPPPEAGPEWKPQAKGPLPPVSFVYTGRLADWGHLQVDIVTDDLQRELAVRLMERKVDELEVLRKRDEDRQRMELERRKALELEREQAAAAAAAARAQAAQQRNEAAQPQRAGEPLPPVLPESNTDRIVPQAGAAPDAEPAAGSTAPQDISEDATAPLEADGSTHADKANPQASYAPGRAVPPRPQARPQPRTRTTTDEVNRALGGWP